MTIILLFWWSLARVNRVVPSRWQATLVPCAHREVPHDFVTASAQQAHRSDVTPEPRGR